MLGGESVSFEIEVDVQADALANGTLALVNTAEVDSLTADGNLRNNTIILETILQDSADLEIAKVSKPDTSVRAGETFTYTIHVDNLGPSHARNVVLTDTILSSGAFTLLGVTDDPNRPDSCTTTSTSGGTVIACSLGESLEPQGDPPRNGRWVIQVAVMANYAQDVDNVVDVFSADPDGPLPATPDPDTSNNRATDFIAVTDVADLKMTKIGEDIGSDPDSDPYTVLAGESIRWTIVVTNAGPSTSENVAVVDILPRGLVEGSVDAVAQTPAPGGGQCNVGTPGDPNEPLICQLGNLAPTDTATVTIEADIDPGYVADQPNTLYANHLPNDAYLTSDTFDPETQNNIVFDAYVTVTAEADLAIQKTGNPDTVVAGDLLEYTVTITNTGPSDAVDVVVSDTLDTHVEFLRARDPYATGVVCSLNPIDEQTLTCALGYMPSGDVLTFMILVQVDPDAPAILHNQVSVSSDTADPNPDNNSDDAYTGVDREQELFITKSDSPDPLLAGTELRYTILFGNNGPSEATDVIVSDTLPLGVTFNRCESLDPNNKVTCSFAPGSGDGNLTPQIVRVEEILDDNVVVYTDTGTIDVGDSFTFLLIADVEPGYILNGRGDTEPDEVCTPFFEATGYPYFAHNRADISAKIVVEGVPGRGEDYDDECTRVDAEADLELTKTDDTGGFLHGDPVAPGGVITYTIPVENRGPSDTAQVVVVDQLPPEGLALDPTKVNVYLDGVQLTDCLDPDDPCFVRDDGLITIAVGNDPDNNGVEQFGRINAGHGVTITIEVSVTLDAECGTTLTNEVFVETRRNDEIWPPVEGAAFAPTPTEDPDQTDNEASEETAIVCPAITIHKTVSLDGTCPGTENVALAFPYQPVTFCYEVINSGDTYLDNIVVTDDLLGYIDTITYVSDPNVPMAPGESKMLSRTDILDCNDRSNLGMVTAEPVNRGRTRLASVPVVYDEDPAYVEAPCEGVDWRILLPTLQTRREEIMVRNLEEGDLPPLFPPQRWGGKRGGAVDAESLLQAVNCETWLQIQNVGNEDTKAVVVIWGDPGSCEPQSNGPLKVECTGLLRPGSAWTFTNNLLPRGARSAIVYSLNATDTVENWRGNELLFADLACKVLGRSIVSNEQEWQFFDYAYRNRDIYYAPPEFPAIVESIDELDFGAHSGEPLAVVVDRTCPGDNEPDVNVNASYVGISADREGLYDPAAGGYGYYAPLVWASHGAPPDDMNSIIHIQNSGNQCTSVEIWLQAQDDCIRPVIGDILALAPGETYPFDPNTVVGPNWQGSAWIASSQPLGIVVDLIGRDLLGAYHGVPANVHELDFSLGTLVNYAPLIYREYQGWETGIQVQNLSSTGNAKVKVYFLDASGDVITTVTDWICPRGSQTFYLPVINDLPGNYVGSARIESQDWWTPGDPPVPAPLVLSVVNIVKYGGVTGPSLEMVTYNGLQEKGAFDWQVGGTYAGAEVLGVPLVAKGNRGITTELAVQNLNPNPGLTDFVLYIYDQNRLLDVVCEKLNEKQVEYINFDAWGFIRPGFLGSIVVSTTYSDQQGGAGLGAVAVERLRRTLTEPDIPGDESKAFEAFPLYNRFYVEGQPECP